MRGDSKIAFAFIALGLAPALIKKSKPLARYLGDQLIRAGEYLHHDSEEPVTQPPVVNEPVAAPPHVEAVAEPIVTDAEEVVAVEEPAVSDAVVATESAADSPTGQKAEDENQAPAD